MLLPDGETLPPTYYPTPTERKWARDFKERLDAAPDNQRAALLRDITDDELDMVLDVYLDKLSGR